MASTSRSSSRTQRTSGLIPIPTISSVRVVFILVFAFLIVHQPYYLSLALAFYASIWLAERLYHVMIALARLLLIAFVLYLVLESLSNYIPPHIPTAGRHDALWLRRAEALMLQSLLRNV
ncbi:hypothetical protein FRB94_012038 [Tulasnella sp. JGI-2019a]|nr:hypothetical protein FRB94_012038 [Tulasnella sp. JGI-2019a]